MKMERLEDIEAWQLARELTRKVHRLTKNGVLRITAIALAYFLAHQIAFFFPDSEPYRASYLGKTVRDCLDRE